MGPELYHHIVTEDLLGHLYEWSSCLLELMSHGQEALDENRSLQIELERSRKLQKEIRENYHENVERLGKLIEDLQKEIELRKRAEETFRDLNETMDLAQKMAGIGYWSYDKATEKRIWSSQMYENFGLDPATGPPKQEDLQKVFHRHDWDHYERAFQGALEGVPYDQVARIRISDGRTHYVHTQGYPRVDDAGEVIGLFGTSRDITERILAEKAIRESEEQYRRIFENSLVGFFQSTPDGRFISVNSAFAKMLRYGSPEELVSDITDIETQYYVNMQDRVRYKEILQREGKLDGFEFKARCKDGSEIWVSNSTRAYFDDAGRVFRYEGIVKDITERKRTEEALLQSEERYRSLVENTLDGYFVCEIPSGRFLFLNQRICDLFRYRMQEALALDIWDVVDPRQHELARERIQERIEGRMPRFASNVYTVVRSDGSTFSAEVSSSLITYQGKSVVQGILRDVTEYQQLQLQLQQAQKFEAIGTLAGGIAHDFNNLLMGIQGRASLVAIDLGSSDPQREHIEAIEEYVHSATRLTRQLLGFARGGKYEVKPIEVNELLAASTDMFGRTRKELRIHMKIHPASLVVEADKQQIEQVLLNIFINAWQAMPAGGDLYIETASVRLEEADQRALGIDPGPYARISITDTGIGMDEATRQRIFDPFFTTKEKGRGTGLGLASAYGIVRNHGGAITVFSEVGQGASIHVYLPLSDGEVHREEAVAEPLARGSETILLVDDEEMIQEVARFMLEKLGYHVLIAGSGQEAIDRVAEKGEAIDLVVLDLIMPGVDGSAAFDRIREIRPRMPVLLASGYAIDGQAAQILERGCNGFLQKPFHISDLSRKVRETLDGSKKPEA
jgi:PAS domain S-box-containing protein